MRGLDAVRVYVRRGQLSVADAAHGYRMLGPTPLVYCVSAPGQAQDCLQGSIRVESRAGGQNSGSIPGQGVNGLQVRRWRTPFHTFPEIAGGEQSPHPLVFVSFPAALVSRLRGGGVIRGDWPALCGLAGRGAG